MRPTATIPKQERTGMNWSTILSCIIQNTRYAHAKEKNCNKVILQYSVLMSKSEWFPPLIYYRAFKLSRVFLLKNHLALQNDIFNCWERKHRSHSCAITHYLIIHSWVVNTLHWKITMPEATQYSYLCHSISKGPYICKLLFNASQSVIDEHGCVELGQN